MRTISFPDGDLGLGDPAEPEEEFDPTHVRIARGSPTDEELGAITAVLAAVYDAGSTADRPRDRTVRHTEWQQSQRVVRGGPGDPFGSRFGR